MHDIAFIDGLPGELHFAFQLKDWSEILRAGQLFAMDDVSVDIGPTQHGITRALRLGTRAPLAVSSPTGGRGCGQR